MDRTIYSIVKGVRHTSFLAIGLIAAWQIAAATGVSIFGFGGDARAAGMTYYVSPSGSGTSANSGAPGSPSDTVRKICDGNAGEIERGDTIIFQDGTYYTNDLDTHDPDASSDGKEIFLGDISCGTSGHIVLMAENTHQAILENNYSGVRDDIGGFDIRNSDYIHIEGFHIKGANAATHQYEHGINFSNGSQHGIARNNRIQDVGGNPLGGGDATHITIDGNYVHDSAHFMPTCASGTSFYRFDNPSSHPDDGNGYSNYIINNRYENIRSSLSCDADANSGNGISPGDGNCIIIDLFEDSGYTNNSTLIANNVCMDVGAGGLHIYNSNNVHVINNTTYDSSNVYDYGEASLTCGNAAYTVDNVHFKGNVLQPVGGSKMIRIKDWTGSSCINSAGIVVENNVYVGASQDTNEIDITDPATTSTWSNMGCSAYNFNNAAAGDVDFINATAGSAGDFDLFATSELIDRGCNNLLTEDHDREARPSNGTNDIGAHEFQVSAPNTSFSFAAAGDFGTSSNADDVLTSIGAGFTDFALALGDLGYVGNGNEATWCDYVKTRVGSAYPFELIAGNHDDNTSGDGDITAYAACLPDRIGGLTGTYGIEYYFDYNDLGRFILISPDINTYGFDYDTGNSHYNWVSSAIDDARANGIEWIVVGMHKNCITPGVKTCEIGDDLMNLLVEKNVDLVLQGHEHAYFRSKQWALGASCPALVIDTYNANCVADTGNTFTQGNGTVLAISGAGGVSLRDVNLGDNELSYFEAWNGSNVGNTYGYLEVDLSLGSLDANFVAVGSGSFTDTFTINASSSNQTPTDLTASTPTIQENNATDTHISPITTTDPDNGDTHTYSLTCDTPGADDSRFQISATAGHIGHLHSNYVFDYETPADTGGTPGDNVYEVCVRTTDDGSPAEHYDKNVDITVTNDTGDDPDTTPPVITLIGANPQTILQNGSYVELGATANDNIDGDITGSIVIDASAVDTNTVGQYSVTYDVADAASNDAVQMVRTVDIIASDTTPPVITLTGANPQTITQGNSYVELGATATDNVDGDVTGSIVIDASAVDTNTLGQYVVTYDVSDAASNDAVQVTRTVDVTVASDTTPPVITLTGANPQTILQNGSYVELGATANDNVDGDISGSIVINASAVDTNTIGQYSVTYDVQDAAANDAVQMVRTVDVTAAADTTPPVITLLGANPLEIVQGATYTDPGATATDNVDGTLTSSIVVGGDTVDVNTIASYNVTYNVSDAASNDAAQQTRVVTVVAGGSDTTKPVITLNGYSHLFWDEGLAFSDPGATALDSVDGDLTSTIVTAGDSVDVNTLGTYVITYNVEDGSGNDAKQVDRTVVVRTAESGTDNDGISDTVEDAAPNDGDGNGDGTKDSDQTNVASAPNPNNTVAEDAYVAIAASDGATTSVTNFGFVFESTTSPDADHEYPLGLFDFSLGVPVGATRTVTLYLDQQYDTSDWVWRKYNTSAGTYADVPGVTYGSTAIGSNTVTTVSYDLTDGGPNDEDGVANGTIVDPAGPAVLGGGLAATGDEIVTLSLTGAMVVGLAALGFVATRKSGKSYQVRR